VGPQGASTVLAGWAEATGSTPIGSLTVLPGMAVTITTERTGAISIQGNVNVFTDKDTFIYVYLDGEPVGTAFYTSVTNAWNNVPFFVIRNVPAGAHTVTLRGSANGSTARVGQRVLTVTAF
jgi:hypothetical protein